MQINGKKILVDPVFSGHASPLKGIGKSFDGTDVYRVADIPAIDYLYSLLQENALIFKVYKGFTSGTELHLTIIMAHFA